MKKNTLIGGIIFSITFLSSCKSDYECEQTVKSESGVYTLFINYQNVSKSEIEHIEKTGNYKQFNTDGTQNATVITSCYQQNPLF